LVAAHAQAVCAATNLIVKKLRRPDSADLAMEILPMPMITVKFSVPRVRPGLIKEVARAVNKLSTEILKKNPTLTVVAIDEVAADRWFIGNKSLAEHELAAFWLEIRIVESTNTREQKSEFIAATFAKMCELIGPLHDESYVLVNEVPGDAYGHSGVTQNERYFKGRLAPVRAA
jgi:4-oxalocrotonate tautomerase